jgi:hypothetical protein
MYKLRFLWRFFSDHLFISSLLLDNNVPVRFWLHCYTLYKRGEALSISGCLFDYLLRLQTTGEEGKRRSIKFGCNIQLVCFQKANPVRSAVH